MNTINFKSLVVSIALFLISIFAGAQSTTDNNLTGPGKFLGYSGAQNLDFRVNNNIRMRLMQTGRLGIGDNNFTPNALLHINPLSYFSPYGNLIRTDGDDSQTLSWSMFSGGNVGNSNRKARFYLSPDTDTQLNWQNTGMVNEPENHLVVESTRGDIVFAAAGASSDVSGDGQLLERARITSAYYNDPVIGIRSVSRMSISSSTVNLLQVYEPLTMLHMGDRWTAGAGGHRNWMHTGSYLQRGTDNAYFGLRPRENAQNVDQTDAVIVWGDNDTPIQRLDALRVIFCGAFDANAAQGTGQSQNGLETMRIHPMGNIGLGDFSINGLNDTPSQKLDVVGRVRVRELRLDTLPDALIVGRQVGDDSLDHVLNHLPFPGDSDLYLSGDGTWQPGGGTGGSDCRWTDIQSPTVTGETDIYTGTLPTDSCYRGKVGIGVKQPQLGKLDVHMINQNDEVRNDEINIATYSRAQVYLEQFQEAIGVFGLADCNGAIGSPQVSIGISGVGRDSRYVVGVKGSGEGTLDGTGESVGVWGRASGGQNVNIGIYGEGPTSGPGVAGYFTGNVVTGQPPLTLSDESLKTEVALIENASSLLNQLQPHTYFLQEPEGDVLQFTDDMQFGLIAQEVQEIIPELVHETFLMEQKDEDGNFIEGTSQEILGVEYVQLIPILIAGFQEQSTTLEAQELVIQDQNTTIEGQGTTIGLLEEEVQEQNAQIETLKNEMAQIKAAVAELNGKALAPVNPANQDGGMQLGQNVPNPFDESTTIQFDLPSDAQVLLEISDASGRPLERLIDGTMPTGSHRVEWNAQGMASGIYFYTLYADGALLTKKMIKR